MGRPDFDLSAAIAGGNGFGPHDDPVLPEMIDLSMFGDPNAQEEDSPVAEEASERDPVEAWMSPEAWPSAITEGSDRSPSPSEPRSEDTVLMEPPWLSEEPPPQRPAETDWTSLDTPWPGETRRPGDLGSGPAGTRGASAGGWGDDPWGAPPVPGTHSADAGIPEDPFPDPWPNQQPAAELPPPGGHPANGRSPAPDEDLWGKPRRFGRKRQERQEQRRSRPEPSSGWDERRQPEEPLAPLPTPAAPDPEEPWQQEHQSVAGRRNGAEPDLQGQPRNRKPVPQQEDPWGRGQHAEAHSDDPWRQAEVRGTERLSETPVAPRPEAGRRDRRATHAPADDPWAEQRRQAGVRPEEAPEDAEQPAPSNTNGAPDAWFRANPDADDEDWRPLPVDLTLEDEAPPPPEVTRKIATKLRVEPTAIKVESGLAYVLVDDEGRPVLR